MKKLTLFALGASPIAMGLVAARLVMNDVLGWPITLISWFAALQCITIGFVSYKLVDAAKPRMLLTNGFLILSVALMIAGELLSKISFSLVVLTVPAQTLFLPFTGWLWQITFLWNKVVTALPSITLSYIPQILIIAALYYLGYFLQEKLTIGKKG